MKKEHPLFFSGWCHFPGTYHQPHPPPQSRPGVLWVDHVPCHLCVRNLHPSCHKDHPAPAPSGHIIQSQNLLKHVLNRVDHNSQNRQQQGRRGEECGPHQPPASLCGSQPGGCLSFRFLTRVVQDGSQAPLGMPCLAFRGRAGLIHSPPAQGLGGHSVRPSEGTLALLPPVSMAQDQAKGRGRWRDKGSPEGPRWQ